MAISYGFVSTHPPTECGLATFNSALAGHLAGDELNGGIVRVVETSHETPYDRRVVHTWAGDDVDGWQRTATTLSGFDVAVVQHEYGIYPGADGDQVVPMLSQLTVPSIVVLHTVLATPSDRQRHVLEQIVREASAVVTMTGAARDRLLAGYHTDPLKVSVIPHGAGDHGAVPIDRGPRPHLLTWGLLGPGKGIEWGVRALARLKDLDPRPRYTVAGKTHPRVIEAQGEVYRRDMQNLANLLGVGADVVFDPVYRDDVELSRLIRSADVVVLPYDSREQVTSGVLIEAVAAGVPVVATPFPHAVELLSDGPGLVVPHADPVALAEAILHILTNPGLTGGLGGAGGPYALRWPEVAARYEALARDLLDRPLAVAA